MPDAREVQHNTIAERYRRFAANEAHGQSASYEAMSGYVASSDTLLDFLASLPADRQQPNLFFAAVRQVAGLPASREALIAAVEQQSEAIAGVMRLRTTQTNEPGRCAVLLPILARLPQPLAIFEVGASAGLCLLPDRYGYDYGRYRISPSEGGRVSRPILPCVANELTSLPTMLPRIGWRGGLDLNPLSVASSSDMDWLETLIWPEQHPRRTRLRAAIEIARHEPPGVIRGNLLHDVPAAIKSVPVGMTLVVFHTAVLGYVNSQIDRDAFARTVRALGAVWISNEVPGVYPDIASKVSEPLRPDRFLLAVNGEPVAWTAPHGQSIEWMASGKPLASYSG